MRPEGKGNTNDLNIGYLILPYFLHYNRTKFMVMLEVT